MEGNEALSRMFLQFYRAVALVFDYESGSSISEIVVEKMFCSGKLCLERKLKGVEWSRMWSSFELTMTRKVGRVRFEGGSSNF